MLPTAEEIYDEVFMRLAARQYPMVSLRLVIDEVLEVLRERERENVQDL